MLAAIFIALALPLAAMINFIVGATQARKAAASVEISPEATAALQRSLEDAAEKNLVSGGLSEGRKVEVRYENDVSDAKQRVIQLAESTGGSATPLGDDKIWAQIPDAQVEFFIQSCVDPETTEPASAQASGESQVLVEVLLIPKRP